MATTSYLNFDIQVIKVDGGYLAVTQGPDGRRSQSTFVLPFGEYQVKYYVSEATRWPQERGEARKRNPIWQPKSWAAASSTPSSLARCAVRWR